MELDINTFDLESEADGLRLEVRACSVYTIKAGHQAGFFESGATENRTRDTRIFSPLLYQLSYGTIPFVWDYKDRQYFLQCKLFLKIFSKYCQSLYFFGIFRVIPGRISLPMPLNFIISSALTPGYDCAIP